MATVYSIRGEMSRTKAREVKKKRERVSIQRHFTLMLTSLNFIIRMMVNF